MTEWVDFREVKDRVSMAMVLAHFGIDMKGTGSKLVGCCPLHDGDNPRAFHVDTEKNVWKCFTGCDKTDRSGGGVIDFVAKKEGVEFRDAALILKQWFLTDAREHKKRRQSRVKLIRPQRNTEQGAQKSEPPAAAAHDVVNPPLDFKLHLRHEHPYLQDERQVPVELAEEFGIGYCPRGIMAGRIAIPIHDKDGNLVAYAGRDTKDREPKYKLPAGFKKQLELYNLHRAQEHVGRFGLILVEGYFDVLRVHRAGFPNVVALLGCSMSDAVERHIIDATDRVIILFDGDEAGRACTRDVAQRLVRKLYIHIVRLQPHEQPDSLSPERLATLLALARS